MLGPRGRLRELPDSGAVESTAPPRAETVPGPCSYYQSELYGKNLDSLASLLHGGGRAAARRGPGALVPAPGPNAGPTPIPVGNGRLGGMVFGGIAREHVQLNEDTIWNGKNATA